MGRKSGRITRVRKSDIEVGRCATTKPPPSKPPQRVNVGLNSRGAPARVLEDFPSGLATSILIKGRPFVHAPSAAGCRRARLSACLLSPRLRAHVLRAIRVPMIWCCLLRLSSVMKLGWTFQKHDKTAFHKHLQEYWFVLTEISENLRNLGIPQTDSRLVGGLAGA